MSSIEYQNTLPKKRMGSGALFFNPNGELLLVEPGYKPTWEIPGGVVELHESPKACCEREILEELGLQVEVGRLLCIDYNRTTEKRLESLMFIFDGGVLDNAMINRIELQAEELLSFRFFRQDQLPENLSASLRLRILTAWQNRTGLGKPQAAVYLEEGELPSY